MKSANNQSIKLSYKYIGNVANSLYVLSQYSLKQKLKVLEWTKQIEDGLLSEEEVSAQKQKIKNVLKSQQFFHAERQKIIHYLLKTDVAKFDSYIEVKGNYYALISLNKYHMYCIVNKKLINKFNAVKVGDSFAEMPLMSDEELEKILDRKEAQRIFKLYYNEVLRKSGKHKAKASTKPNAVRNPKPKKEKVLSKTISKSGSVVVIKKKKPFKVMIPTD